MQQTLSYKTAHGLLRNIHNFLPGDFDALGVTKQDLELLTGEMPWRRDHMYVVMRTFDSVTFGALEILAQPKIQIPAEFLATVICTVVHPINIWAITSWLANERKISGGVQQMSQRPETTGPIDNVSEHQLFALATLLMTSDDTETARKRVMESLGIAAEKQAEQEMAHGQANQKAQNKKGA